MKTQWHRTWKGNFPAHWQEVVYKLWKSNANPNRISELLNEKNIPPRIAKFWNRNSVISFLTRFEQKQIVSKEGQLELR